MQTFSVVERFRNWRERIAALAELRRLDREKAPYQRIEFQALVEAVKTAASCDDREATIRAFNQLRARAPDVAISSATVIRSLMKVGSLDLAESVAKEGLTRFPHSRELLLIYGEIAQHRRNWVEMAQRFEVMRKFFPHDVWAHMLNGRALRELGNFDEADQLLKHAIGLEPLLSPPAVEYARIAQQRGDLEEALRRWDYVRSRFEDRAAWIEAASILSRTGREDEAITLLNTARWQFQNKPEPIIELARLFIRNGDLEEAARQWKALRDQFPQDERGFIDGASTLCQLGRQDEAEAILSTYADRRNAHPAGLVAWARIVSKRDEYEAVRRWAIVRERCPDQPEGYVEGGAALDLIGQNKEADLVRAERPQHA